MKRTAVLTVIILLAAASSIALAGDEGEGKAANLFLFQKCDSSLVPALGDQNPKYDSAGCPLAGNGPWPIFLENSRWGQMDYNMLGDEFRFSFEGKRLLPETEYTLIYYPDEWPGKGLVCLGKDQSNPKGNLQIKGKLEIPSGLPAPYDKNYNPAAPSGAVGAKIWLVPTTDVQCEGTGDIDPTTGLQANPSQMLSWNPVSYLFEGNLIVYQYAAEATEDADDDDEPADVSENDGNKSKDKGKK
jgi:hypothetical protein